jgi:hypothetical protein
LEAAVGLPSDGLELRLALHLGSSASASALAKKLEQALTLASFAVPAEFGLTRALRSALVTAKSQNVHLLVTIQQSELRLLLGRIGPPLARRPSRAAPKRLSEGERGPKGLL